MHLKLVFFFCSFGVLILIAQMPFAQEQPGSSPVVIQITDPSGAVLANARTKIEPPPDVAQKLLQTSPSGTLEVKLVPGTYQISVIVVGFSPAPQAIYVNQQTRRLTVKVQPKPNCEVIPGGNGGMVSLEPVRSDAKLPHAMPPSASPVPVVLRIKVVDPTGAYIPHAKYELLSQSRGPCGEVGADGKFALTLPTGKYDMRVSSQGFRVWKQEIDLKEDEQEVTATLYVDSGGGPIVIPDPAEINQTPK